jgi:HEPN domain-containing protein
MKDETKIWLDYANENFQSAKILLASELFNPCLQNIQQCVEKALKALFVENLIKLKKTHSIAELKNVLRIKNINVEISEEDCEFLDSIYLPSKYPLTSVLPHYEPDLEICNKGISIAEAVLKSIQNILK